MRCGSDWADMAQKASSTTKSRATSIDKPSAKAAGKSAVQESEDCDSCGLQPYLADRHILLRQQLKAKGGLLAIQKAI